MKTVEQLAFEKEWNEELEKHKAQAHPNKDHEFFVAHDDTIEYNETLKVFTTTVLIRCSKSKCKLEVFASGKLEADGY